jgi:hypothetical protein
MWLRVLIYDTRNKHLWCGCIMCHDGTQTKTDSCKPRFARYSLSQSWCKWRLCLCCHCECSFIYCAVQTMCKCCKHEKCLCCLAVISMLWHVYVYCHCLERSCFRCHLQRCQNRINLNLMQRINLSTQFNNFFIWSHLQKKLKIFISTRLYGTNVLGMKTILSFTHYWVTKCTQHLYIITQARI